MNKDSKVLYLLLIIVAIISGISLCFSISGRKIYNNYSDSNKNTNSTKEVEFTNDSEYVKWRYIGDETWNNLIALSELKGESGVDGINGTDGANGKNGKNGVSAKNIELKVDRSTLMWRYVGTDEWKTLINIADLSLFDGHNPIILSVNGKSKTLGCVTISETCIRGTIMSIQVSHSEAYNFYVIKDDGEYLTLIMDRNIGLPSEWNSAASIVDGPQNLFETLTSRTSGWNNIKPIQNYLYTNLDYINAQHGYQKISISHGVGTITRNDGTNAGLSNANIRARIITQEEVNGLGCTTSASTCPSWLYSNLANENNSATPYGYWTLTTHYTNSNPNYGYSIHYNGSVYAANVLDNGKGRGIRPVITIKKYVSDEEETEEEEEQEQIQEM